MTIDSGFQGTLQKQLSYTPKNLQFGTSGRRGLVADLSQLEIFINVIAELDFLKSLSIQEGGIVAGDIVYYAYDLRPSSYRYVKNQGNRGKLAQTVAEAIRHAGMVPVNCGQIPTPALSFYALQQGNASIMVTGSHIPFERNGYKTNTAKGELLKQHEQPINDRVAVVREQFYSQPFADSLFSEDGFLKVEPSDLPPAQPDAAITYQQRYLDFFGQDCLHGLKLLVFQHSAVGRDLLVEILAGLGAFVVPVGRSEQFVPIDTENIQAEQLAALQSLYDDAAKQHGHAFDAIVSTDGDSDRPLIVAIEPASQEVRFFGGDLVGMLTAGFLQAKAVVVPISCNDAIDHGDLKSSVQPKTRIGSPFVIEGMEKALADGKQAVCGWEANGGFLTASTFNRNGRLLQPLPTRDAVLPIVTTLTLVKQENLPLTALFAQLPRRYSAAALLKQIPKPVSQAIVKRFSPSNTAICTVEVGNGGYQAFDTDNQAIALAKQDAEELSVICSSLVAFFTPVLGFGAIVRLNYLDGVRIYFANQDIAHIRASGNADELRIYAVAGLQERAHAITLAATKEPDGILRQLATLVAA